MKTIIKATAPSSYQVTELNYFHLPHIKSPLSGTHAEAEFKDQQSAKDHLKKVAEGYFEDEDKLSEAINQIDKYGYLTLDRVTATIENEL